MSFREANRKVGILKPCSFQLNKAWTEIFTNYCVSVMIQTLTVTIYRKVLKKRTRIAANQKWS